MNLFFISIIGQLFLKEGGTPRIKQGHQAANAYRLYSAAAAAAIQYKAPAEELE
jgi:hypothetical protein